MPPKKNVAINESELNKGEKRKLEALRKSLGPEIADKAFAEWLAERPSAVGQTDPMADMISDELMRLIEKEGLQIPRGGFLVRRGRGRVIVESATGGK